jgi:GntR family transcriptional regulator / MocR family aminotransferase
MGPKQGIGVFMSTVPTESPKNSESSSFPYTAIQLAAESAKPLYRQLYEELRRLILSGQLLAGTQLPATRTLAMELKLSRNTIVNAIDQLIAEGYLDTHERAGTYVSSSLSSGVLNTSLQRQSHHKTRLHLHLRTERLSQQSTRSQNLVSDITMFRANTHAFRLGLPALDEFPFDVWGRLHAWHSRHSLATLTANTDLNGYGPLRETIAAYLASLRGVQCNPAQVIIVSGSQQAIDLVSRVLIDPGDTVWMEDPGYIGARMVFANSQARIIPVPIDAEGLNIEAGIQRSAQVKLIYTSPSFQHPLGITMSLPRRLALLQCADNANAWILEDDYDSEYRYTGRPLAALQALDSQHRVIYVGSFSKVLFPSLRLGYLVVPRDLVSAFLSVRAFVDSYSSPLDQAVLADFIDKGYFARHIRRMCVLYAKRQANLINAVENQLQGALEIHAAQGGMHLVGWLPKGVDDSVVSKQAALHGIEALPLSFLSLGPLPRGALLLGYTAIHQQELNVGVEKLSAALSDSIDQV